MARKILAAVGWSGILFLSVASSAHAQDTKNAAPEAVCVKTGKKTFETVNGNMVVREEKICTQAK